MKPKMITVRNQNVLSEEPELKNLKLLFGIYTFLIISDYIMPQYFGIHIGYDITCTRFANIVIILYMLFNPKIFSHFCKTIYECNLTIPVAMYLFVAGYTMVFRTDLNSFFLVFLEILTLYMLIYGIRYVVGYNRAVRWSVGCAYFFGVYGIVEYIYGQSIFHKFLSTVPNKVGNSYRSGHYRIMGPCGHALGYGMLLLLFIAIACIDLKKNEVYLFKRPLLIILLLVNVFLTGSRSTLGIAVVEVVVIMFLSGRENIKKSLIIILACVLMLGVFLAAFQKTKIGQYMLMQITSVLDQVLGTSYAGKFGAQTERLENSELYRKALPYIFTLDWLNPFLGRGVSTNFSAVVNGVTVQSIDNYYVAQYIKYAYPGLVSYLAFIAVTICSMVHTAIRYKSAAVKALLVGTVCYYYNLWWVDALQTLKYEYILIAMFYAILMVKKEEQGDKQAAINNRLLSTGQ